MTELIINLTQHVATADQAAAGVREPNSIAKAGIQRLLMFYSVPTKELVNWKARKLAAVAAEFADPSFDYAMIGGAPYMMPALAKALRLRNITPLFSFSVRDSEEVDDGEGGVKKVSVFRHLGWVEG